MCGYQFQRLKVSLACLGWYVIHDVFSVKIKNDKTANLSYMESISPYQNVENFSTNLANFFLLIFQ